MKKTAILETPKVITIPHCKCAKCGHKWSPRTGAPKRCPNCKNVDWHIPYQRKNSRRHE